MLEGRRVAVVLPAYNAARTLERTLRELPRPLVDDTILVDDGSRDGTAELARSLGVDCVHEHPRNRGYGGNQKSCYRLALERGADLVVMLHPDYQYSPRLVTALAALLCSGHYDVALASRMLGDRAREGGMPLYKYLANRALTATENALLGVRLSEYHTGYRAYTRAVLEALPLAENSEDFVFDNQLLAQAVYFGFRIGELSCPTRYEPDSSSISASRSVVYGLGVLATAARFLRARAGLGRDPLFSPAGRTLLP